MSRSKTVDTADESTETLEAVETTGTTSSISKAKRVKKMGVDYFLQKHPQKPAIAALLRAKYKGVTMTEEEWLNALDALLNKKIVS